MPTWYYLALLIPGLFGFLLVFFTPMILNAAEHNKPQKLKKRAGARD